MTDKLKDEIQINSAEYLFRKIKKTAKTKFNCEYRLNLHIRISFWVINIVSFLLIFIGIIDIIKQNNVNSNVITTLIYSILILVYSLMLKNSNNHNTVREMKVSGTELLHLADRLQPYCNKEIEINLYNSFSNKYKNILLKTVENTKKIDYELMKLDFKDYYKPKWKQIFVTKIKYYFGFFHYFFVLLLLIITVVYFILH